MNPRSPYSHCPHCRTTVPVDRRISGIALGLLVLMALSFLVTAILYPRILFLFIFLPFGFRFWRRSDYCGVCGGRLPAATPPG